MPYFDFEGVACMAPPKVPRCEGVMTYIGHFDQQETQAQQVFDEDGEPHVKDVTYMATIHRWQCTGCNYEVTDY